MNKTQLQGGKKRCNRKNKCNRRGAIRAHVGGEQKELLLSSSFIIFALLILAAVIYMYYKNTNNETKPNPYNARIRPVEPHGTPIDMSTSYPFYNYTT